MWTKPAGRIGLLMNGTMVTFDEQVMLTFDERDILTFDELVVVTEWCWVTNPPTMSFKNKSARITHGPRTSPT